MYMFSLYPTSLCLLAGAINPFVFKVIGGFPHSSVGKEYVCNAGDPAFKFLGWEDPLEKGKATHSSILACRTP